MAGEVELERCFKPRVLQDIHGEILGEERVVKGCNQCSFLLFPYEHSPVALRNIDVSCAYLYLPCVFTDAFSQFQRDTRSKKDTGFESDGPGFETVLS